MKNVIQPVALLLQLLVHNFSVRLRIAELRIGRDGVSFNLPIAIEVYHGRISCRPFRNAPRAIHGELALAVVEVNQLFVRSVVARENVHVITANRPGPSYVCLNQGGGHFAAECIPIPAQSATSIVPADFDKDGFVDLAVPSRDGGQSHMYFNDGKAGFARTAPFGPSDAAARVGAASDFNADGSIDLVVGDEKAASMIVYLNDGKGRLTVAFHVADKARTPYAIAAGDLNSDGSPDIVLGYTAGPHSAFFNDGTGRQFTRIMFGDAKGAAHGFALGDVNGDKFPDIALARPGAPNVLYLSSKCFRLNAPTLSRRLLQRAALRGGDRLARPRGQILAVFQNAPRHFRNTAWSSCEGRTA